jgi:hypothetical protein
VSAELTLIGRLIAARPGTESARIVSSKSWAKELCEPAHTGGRDPPVTSTSLAWLRSCCQLTQTYRR